MNENEYQTIGLFVALCTLVCLIIQCFIFSRQTKIFAEQSRQATRADRANAHGELSRSLRDLLIALVSDREMCEAFLGEKKFAFAGLVLNHLESVYQLRRIGQLSETVWIAESKYADHWSKIKAIRDLWGIVRDSYSDDFATFFDQLVDKNKNSIIN